MVATASARSVAVSCWALTSASGTARPRPRTATERMITRLIYLLLFVSPQVLLYLYLRERLADPTRPERARLVRTALAAVFTSFNLPWAFVVGRVLFGSVWGVGRIPYLGPWIAWQLLGWIFGALVTVYLLGKGAWWLGRRVRGTWFAPVHRRMWLSNGRNHAPRTTQRSPAASSSPAPRTPMPLPAPRCR